MKNFMMKMRKVNMSSWGMLSAGEKVLKVGMVLLKVAVVAAVITGVVSLAMAAGLFMLFLVALGNVSEMGNGPYNNPYNRW